MAEFVGAVVEAVWTAITERFGWRGFAIFGALAAVALALFLTLRSFSELGAFNGYPPTVPFSVSGGTPS